MNISGEATLPRYQSPLCSAPHPACFTGDVYHPSNRRADTFFVLRPSCFAFKFPFESALTTSILSVLHRRLYYPAPWSPCTLARPSTEAEPCGSDTLPSQPAVDAPPPSPSIKPTRLRAAASRLPSRLLVHTASNPRAQPCNMNSPCASPAGCASAWDVFILL